MKSTLAMFTFLLTSSALACPAVSGTYSCAYQDGAEKMTLSTRVDGGMSVVTYNGNDMPADGVVRQLPVQDDTAVDYSVSCTDQTISVATKMDGKSPQLAELAQMACGIVGLSHVAITTTWTPNGDVINEGGTGAIVCANGDSMPLAGDSVCTKIDATSAPAVRGAQLPFLKRVR